MQKKRQIFQPMVAAVLLLTVLFGLAGCGAPKYRVDYDGCEGFYTNAKDSYRAGKEVELVYDLIASDTDYAFYLDGEPVDWTYDPDRGFVITFIMPDHDVKLTFTMVNSMLPPESYE